MKKSGKISALLATSACAATLLAVSVGWTHDTSVSDSAAESGAHGGGEDGHIPSNVNYGFKLVSQSQLAGVATGKYTDVWEHKGYAYVGTFQDPTCDRSGAFVVDINDPTNPSVVAEIASPPSTRFNDVKAHEIGGRDYLFTTLEKCGDFVGNGQAVGGGNGGHQQGQGGVSVYDITDPAKPHAVKQNLLDFQTHNTFPWTDASTGKSYLMVVDDENINDVHIVDVTKPQSPKLISTTGIGDWLGTTTIADDGQLQTGVFAAPLLHDIWVEQVNGEWQAILSYWDAGFVTLDVSEPTNPAFIGDSTYPAVDPIHGISPMEGNAHAAVFGGDSNQYIFAGDEDFDSIQVGISVPAIGAFFAASQGNGVPLVGPGADIASVSGGTEYVGRACSALAPAPGTGLIAMVERGDCAFTTKVGNASDAGYAAMVVFNQSVRPAGDSCETGISMAVDGIIPALFVPRSSGLAILGMVGYDPSTCTNLGPDSGDAFLASMASPTGLPIDIAGVFDGWGYFHVLNNVDQVITVPGTLSSKAGSSDVGYLGHIGYYAPAELADPSMATGFGDLTMHNVETDPVERHRSYVSWYALGMRALEYRPGHFHDNSNGEGSYSWNVHEVGRWIAPTDPTDPTKSGSNFWGVTVADIGGQQYILASDRNTGLHIFTWECEGRQGSAGNNALYCDPNL